MFISGINIDLKRNKHKIRRMECALHDESVRDVDKLQTLSALALWHTILFGAKSRNHAPILQQAEYIRDGEFPSVKYHLCVCKELSTTSIGK